MPHRTQWAFAPVAHGTEYAYVLEYDIPVPLLGAVLDSLFVKPQWSKILENVFDNLERRFVPLEAHEPT
jgi:hypothetical protein